MAGTFLGLDIGTSGVKALLIDDAQQPLAEATHPLEVSRPHPGWSEQAPDDWWAATEAAIDKLALAAPEKVAAVEGIGLSGQQHGATLLGSDDRPLRPAILWNDGRSSAECGILEARADFRGICGNVLMAGFTAPKLEWVKRHEPETFDRTETVLLPKDYVRLRLSGEKFSDMSDSAGTGWLDVAAREWSTPLLEASGLDVGHMPALAEGSQPAGALREELARRWGMTGRPVIAGGGGDNAASACGVGALAPGAGFLSLGTSGVLFVATGVFAPNTGRAVHAFCHAVPDTWHQMGVILSATDSLNWLSRITGKTPADLAAAAEGVETDVIFHPYLSGERTPHNNAAARGAFVGLGQTSEVPALARAVLEGVAFAFADSADALAAAGTDIGTVYAIGGGARSALWLQILADATGMALALPAHGDFGGAFGAARLGMLAASGADPAAVCTPPEVQRMFEPDPKADYTAKLARYRDLYAPLNPT